jgi:D-glycero-alpha-D-manno-heptose-7-phosphate kinase
MTHAADVSLLAHQAAAPVRLDFAGGWTDVPPFSAREGGVVVTAAIGLYSEARVTPGGTTLRLVSEDLGDSVELSGAAELADDGRLSLLKAGLRMLPVGSCSLCTRSDAPPGSGLGSSGALDVAIVGALAHARAESLEPVEIAERAWRLEAIEARIPGGRQDQFSAALGGFQCMRFLDPGIETTALVLDADFASELERRMVLCYMGASRFSGATISRVMQAYERGESRVVAALHGLRAAADRMADALRAADLAAVGALLGENWRHQQALDAGMRTAGMAALERRMAEAGVLGGKAAGSGAGGSMFFIAGDDVASARNAARDVGVRLLPVTWAPHGVRAW